MHQKGTNMTKLKCKSQAGMIICKDCYFSPDSKPRKGGSVRSAP